MIKAFLEVYETVERVCHNFVWSLLWGAIVAYFLGMTFHTATGLITLAFSLSLILDFLMFSHIQKRYERKIDDDSSNYSDK